MTASERLLAAGDLTLRRLTSMPLHELGLNIALSADKALDAMRAVGDQLQAEPEVVLPDPPALEGAGR